MENGSFYYQFLRKKKSNKNFGVRGVSLNRRQKRVGPYQPGIGFGQRFYRNSIATGTPLGALHLSVYYHTDVVTYVLTAIKTVSVVTHSLSVGSDRCCHKSDTCDIVSIRLLGTTTVPVTKSKSKKTVLIKKKIIIIIVLIRKQQRNVGFRPGEIHRIIIIYPLSKC